MHEIHLSGHGLGLHGHMYNHHRRGSGIKTPQRGLVPMPVRLVAGRGGLPQRPHMRRAIRPRL